MEGKKHKFPPLLGYLLLSIVTSAPSLNLFFTGGVAFSLSLLVFIIFHFKKNFRALNLPPGSKGWHIMGNLFQFALSGKTFIHYICDLCALSDPIFTHRMGSRILIVITSAELAHKALITKGQEFASMPPENPTLTIFSCDKLTVNSVVYGPEWRSLRCNMVSSMLSSARLKEFRLARETGMDRFIDRIPAEAESSEGAVWVLKNARFAIFCILITMCFGVHLDGGSINRIDQFNYHAFIPLTCMHARTHLIMSKLVIIINSEAIALRNYF
ncbi:cytochrome P450 77A2-like [Asparagus officinalis]|uniref:cytochrome P450 77A2-like n=1 Tax=Asparagus officinalis TaxID=4686 RepID=UPI00098E4E7D|nr:cytochrome P450 77A2-like [Asparagus officinalis]